MGAQLCSGRGSSLSERGLWLVCASTDERSPAASQQLHEASRELRTHQPAVLAYGRVVQRLLPEEHSRVRDRPRGWEGTCPSQSELSGPRCLRAARGGERCHRSRAWSLENGVAGVR